MARLPPPKYYSWDAEGYREALADYKDADGEFLAGHEHQWDILSHPELDPLQNGVATVPVSTVDNSYRLGDWVKIVDGAGSSYIRIKALFSHLTGLGSYVWLVLDSGNEIEIDASEYRLYSFMGVSNSYADMEVKVTKNTLPWLVERGYITPETKADIRTQVETRLNNEKAEGIAKPKEKPIIESLSDVLQVGLLVFAVGAVVYFSRKG